MRTAVFTIISPNYRHYARVLMASLMRHEPQWERFVLLAGATEAPADEPSFETVLLDALPLPEPRQLCFRYTLLELDTALKPWMFEHLFARGFDRVVYLDPDIQLFSPLVELDTQPDGFLTLTPHVTRPRADDPHCPERGLLLAGSYNLGFLALTRRPQLTSFLRWWQGKLEHHCLNDQARGLFVDQRWMDLVPGLFDGVSILRHEGYNVAYWNLGRRPVGRDSNGAWTALGAPLRFMHFSGFGGRAPDKASAHSGLSLDAIGDARQLFSDYATALDDAGRATYASAPYAYATFSDGSPVHDWMRIIYRESSELQAAAGPDPFVHPELFDPGLVAHANVATQRLITFARRLTHVLPPELRASLRKLLYGRRSR